VDVNAVNQAGDSALHVAAVNKFDSVIRLLAERGARLDARNKKGQSPLAAALAPPLTPWGTVGVDQAARGRALGGAALSRYRERYAAWEASQGQTSTADLLRSLGATEE
jgi:uncharacterized small protein (DUF1192 family)